MFTNKLIRFDWSKKLQYKTKHNKFISNRNWKVFSETQMPQWFIDKPDKMTFTVKYNIFGLVETLKRITKSVGQ